jgi:hypothetical protein
VLVSAPSWWGRLFSEFECGKCDGHEAYRSRPRGFFEKRLLPLFLLKPVRCEHCYHRVYVFRTVPALERAVGTGKPAQSQSAKVSTSGQRIA